MRLKLKCSVDAVKMKAERLGLNVVVERGRGSTTTNDLRERDSFETWEGLAEPKKLIESTLFQKLTKHALFSEVHEPNNPKFNA